MVDNRHTRGWMARAKSMGPKGSPYCTPNEEDRRNSPKYR